MKKMAAGGFVVLVIVAASASLASAHSWYPKECCSDQDCMPADRIEVDSHGDLPRGFALRPSHD